MTTKVLTESKLPCLAGLRRMDLSKAKVRLSGDISSVFTSFSGEQEHLNEQKFAQLKKELVKDPQALKESWKRLKLALSKGIEEIKAKGPSIVPSIDFSKFDSLSETDRADIFKRGCVVIRNVIPKETAVAWKNQVVDYTAKNPTTKGFPKDSPVVYELYWSKPQVEARSHPNMMKAMNFMNHLWHADEDSLICLDKNVSYADRLRIRNAGDKFFSLGPHADGGSLERWEDKLYVQSYRKIFEGKWEEFDPYDIHGRLDADMDYYESQGTCSVFRSFQGWLAASEIAPKEGSILFAPLVKEVTAYYMLKPYFDENDELTLDGRMPGAFPGKGLEFNDRTHPELNLSDLMVHIPKVQPGDMVYWHCDLIHAVDNEHMGDHDSLVFYIPSAPLCQTNLKYALTQREAFLKGLVGPDFPGFPNDVAETQHKDRGGPEDVMETGGIEAMREFLLAEIEIDESYSEGAKKMIAIANEQAFGK